MRWFFICDACILLSSRRVKLISKKIPPEIPTIQTVHTPSRWNATIGLSTDVHPQWPPSWTTTSVSRSTDGPEQEGIDPKTPMVQGPHGKFRGCLKHILMDSAGLDVHGDQEIIRSLSFVEKRVWWHKINLSSICLFLIIQTVALVSSQRYYLCARMWSVSAPARLRSHRQHLRRRHGRHGAFLHTSPPNDVVVFSSKKRFYVGYVFCWMIFYWEAVYWDTNISASTSGSLQTSSKYIR